MEEEKKYNFIFDFYEFKEYNWQEVKDPLFGNLESLIEKFIEKKDSNKITIVFAKMRDLHEKESLNKLVDIVTDNNNNFSPVILIGLEKLRHVINYKLDALAQSTTNKVQATKEELLSEKKIIKSLNLDSRIDFFDSSIWYYYLPLDSEFNKNFGRVLNTINDNFEKKLYELDISREFHEFNTRLFSNSFLANIGGGHSSAVTPFRFHSETKMKMMADDYLEGKNGKPRLPDYNWRILLVDDYADKRLRIDGKEEGTAKEDILKKVLPYKWIDIEKCNSISDFIDKYSNENKIYDIILLDYLLDNSYKQNSEREYSTDILKWIKGKLDFIKEKENGKIKLVESKKSENLIGLNKNLKGPLGKFWFFPISAFSFAFMEDIRQMGYTFYDDDWVIARGADPVNTPELFRYSLFKLMEAQLDDALGYKNSFSRLPIIELFNRIFDDFVEGGFSNVSSTARKEFPNFIEMYSKINSLKNIEGKSTFASTVIKNIEKKFPGLIGNLEHLNHIIYSTAFQSFYHWPIIQDELKIINSNSNLFINSNIKHFLYWCMRQSEK